MTMKRIAYLLALALALTGAVSLNPMASSAGASSNPLTIIYPAIDHQRFERGPVTISLRIEGADALGFRASLNGKDVTSLFGRPRIGRMRAAFGAEYLKHGVNNFVAQLREHKAWRSFRVRSLRTDAGAGGPTPQATPGLWVPIQTRIISGDGTKASDYAIKVGDQIFPAPTPSDQSATGYQIVLLDRATLQPISQNSNVSLPSGDGNKVTSLYGAQGPLANLNQCGGEGCLLVVQSLQTLGVTATNCPVPPTNCSMAAELFNFLGGSTRLDYANGQTANTGYSLIANVGPSGAQPGTGYERLTCNQASDCGRNDQIPTAGDRGAISGALIKDSNGVYTFAYPGRATFSTGTGDSETSNTITIGGTPNGGQYTSDTIVDEGAFHVVVIYRDSLQLVYQNTFNFDELYSDDPSVWTMTSALNDVANRGNYMVLISSIGNLPAKPNYWQAQWVRVGQALERLGGTYSLFMSLAAGDDYTFVGGAYTRLGDGAAEASKIVTRETTGNSSPLASNLRGVLAQNHQGNYAVSLSRFSTPPDADGNLTDSTIEDFSDSLIDGISLQPPTTWPATDTPGRQAAYRWINAQVLPASDLRGSYINSENPFDTWSSEIKGYSCPQGQGFTCPQTQDSKCPADTSDDSDFCTVQKQLADETNYAYYVTKHETDILGVYTDNQANISLLLDGIETDIKNIVDPPSEARNATRWETIFAVAQTIIGDAGAVEGGPPAKLALDTGFSMIKLASAFSNDENGSPLENAEHTIDEFKTKAVDDFLAHQAVIGNAFDLILTDWGRLEALGNPLVGQKIIWDKSKLANIQKSLNVSLRREVFTKFIASTYQLGRWTDITTDPTDLKSVCSYTQFTACIAGDCTTLCDTPRSDRENWEALLSSPGNGLKYDIWLMSRDVKCSAGNDGELLSPLFAPLNSNDQTKLGIYKPYFFYYPSGNMRVLVNPKCDKNY
jgi:hypothetical protein